MTEFISQLPAQTVLMALGIPASIAALWLLTAYRGRVASVGKAIRRQTAEPFNHDPRPTPPGASIVVVAGDDAPALERLLTKLFEQEYTGEMEVIVVNDGKNDDVKDVVTRLKHLEHRPNLYITFTPPGLRNVSHRKLALTLGIKAAKHPVIITLTEQSRLYSGQWLARMMAPFGREEVELVIGSALPGAKFDSGWGRRYRSFTHGADTVKWLSAALRDKAYRGHRNNLAFRRDAFFSSGGFNGALNLRDGDDDIFISKIARPGNTEVVCAAQAAVRYSSPTPRRQFREGRSARIYSGRGLGRSTARFFGFSSLMAWVLAITTLVGIGYTALTGSWMFLGGFALLLVGTWTVLALTWRRTLKALRCLPAAPMVFPMMLRRPLTNLIHKMRSRSHRSDYHTWSA